MKKFQNTNIKVISKVSEYEACDAVDIAYDAIDYSRAESVKNGVQISRQIGKRRIIDRNRNAIAHEQIDYSQFKVTKLDAGQTVDNSKKEKQLEDAALSLLADLGISWDEDENEDDDTVENETEQTDSNTEEEDQQEMPEGFDSLIADIVGDTVENTKDQSITINKCPMLTDWWDIFEGSNKIGRIESNNKGRYQTIINGQKCFTGTISNCKCYAKSKLWK